MDEFTLFVQTEKILSSNAHKTKEKKQLRPENDTTWANLNDTFQYQRFGQHGKKRKRTKGWKIINSLTWYNSSVSNKGNEIV